MNKFVIRQSLILLLCAAIWGSAFVAQSVGMDFVGPFTFGSSRSFVGFLVLLPYIFLVDRGRKKKNAMVEQGVDLSFRNKQLLMGGICCGVILTIASNLQQFGIKYTTVGKAGFITALYIVMVPLLGIFIKKKAGLLVWISVAIAVAGLYFLTMNESLSLSRGDTYVILCAIVFAMHILTIDHFAPLVDGVKMSCIQFLVCGILSGIFMLLFEKPELSHILMAWKPICYAGAFSSGVAYTLQIVGQRGMNPTVASLLMSMESVFAVLAGFLILHQVMSTRECIGCVLMAIAIVLAQLPQKEKA